MRIKNQKANEQKYKLLERQAYDRLVSWYKTNVTEVLKAKCKLVQEALLEFFKCCKKPTTTQVLAKVEELENKYLSHFQKVRCKVDYVNSLDDGKALFFNIDIDFNGFYRRKLVQENGQPNIDRKPVILDIEITDEEISEYANKEAMDRGKFEEI